MPQKRFLYEAAEQNLDVPSACLADVCMQPCFKTKRANILYSTRTNYYTRPTHDATTAREQQNKVMMEKTPLPQ
eukprot:496543-Amphidinium_carterae.1